MIGIRVDGNQKIASGHVMRCIAIAQELRAQNQECIFILADNIPIEMVEKNQFPVVVLNTKWDHLEEEVEKLLEVIKKYKINKLLIDSYYVTNTYLEQLKKQTRIIYIDDLESEIYNADLIVNYSIYCNKSMYQQKYQNKNARLLIGTEYAPLRREFLLARSKLNSTVRDILITSGASDPYHIIVGCINEILQDEELRKCNLHIIAGKFYGDIDRLKELQSVHPNIIVYTNIRNMAEVMAKADIAISAGGTTLLELCCCQLVTVSFAFADNQIKGVEAYAEAGIIETVGDIRMREEQAIKQLIKKVKALYVDYGKREVIRKKMQSITQGKGAEKIAKEIIHL